MTMLFQIDYHYETTEAKQYAEALVTRPSRPDGVCPDCGHEILVHRGAAYGEVYKGSAWPLVMSADHGVLFQERVIDIFDEEGLGGFTPYPVSFEKIKSKQLRLIHTPAYYYLGLSGGVKIDAIASGIKCLPDYCDECGREKKYAGTLRRFAVRPETWNGSDFFTIINHPCNVLGCSQRAIEIFRKHNIDNLAVFPLDILRRYVGYWNSIDYLGPVWPPERWYPVPMSASKPVEEWLRTLISIEMDGVYLPLMDFMPDIAGALIEKAEHGNDLERWNALRALQEAHDEGHEVPPHLLEQARALTSTPPLSVLRARLFTGTEHDRDTASYYLTQLRAEQRIDLSDQEREAILRVLPHMPPSALD